MSEPLRSWAVDVPARWPARVLELAGACREAGDAAVRDAALAELWTLLHLGLARYVRVHAARRGRLAPEDVRDIASDKSLELVQKLEAGEWDPTAAGPAQLCAFLSTLARNGMVDHFRSNARWRAPGARPAQVSSDETRRPQEAPSRELWRVLFPAALAECLGRLTPRARTIWILRVLYEMPSKGIGGHPDVRVSPAAVDVSLARSRIALRRCMNRKGFDSRELPRGTFAALWEMLRAPGSRERPT